MGTPLKLKRIGGGPEREVELVSIVGAAITARIDGLVVLSVALETLGPICARYSRSRGIDITSAEPRAMN